MEFIIKQSHLTKIVGVPFKYVRWKLSSDTTGGKILDEKETLRAAVDEVENEKATTV